ncbi:MATE family efflux transporter [Thermophagus xiamenensis]|uniref:Multidrug-efflux transporter n=1 Tax=Thermophagus xiamenensis TaxID=385682 RepID=A0A1I2ALW0_9BACT|nr:MATE family efflux transporter [Thermophagus xiamenensis]SFE45015.1 multidrug resistance protein, MATE family [Thermophagus xiamenensis]
MPILQKYRAYYRSNFLLGLPVMLAQAGQMIVVLADNLMVGRLGTVPLAAASFANTVYIVGMVFGIGMVNGLTPLVGKACGGGDTLKAAMWLKQGLYAFQVATLALSLLLWLISYLMPFMGQADEIVQEALPYYRILVVSMIPNLLFFTFKQFAEGLGNTRIAMVITIVSNIVNILLNYLWIFGKWGFPALGLMGAGYATLVARILMALFFIVVYFSLDFFKEYRLKLKKTHFSWSKSKYLLMLGLPIGGQHFIEVLAFSLGSIMMGWLGASALAAHQIVLSFASFTFMISQGIAAATTVKVSHLVGQRFYDKIRTVTFASLHLVLLFMGFSAVLFMVFREVLPAFFIQQPEVIAIAAGLMVVAGGFQLFDGLQVTMLGALRGLEDVRMPFAMLLIAYFCLALPAGWLFAFVLDAGPNGIWFGYLLGLVSISLFLLLRFRWITLRKMKRA